MEPVLIPFNKEVNTKRTIAGYIKVCPDGCDCGYHASIPQHRFPCRGNNGKPCDECKEYGKKFADDESRVRQVQFHLGGTTKTVMGLRKYEKIDGKWIATITTLGRFIFFNFRGSTKKVIHKNRDFLDFTRANLLIVEPNMSTITQAPRNGRKYKGIWYNPKRNKYESCIQAHKRKRFLGYYDTEIDAAIAYDTAAKKLFPEGCYLNFPNED